MDEPSGSPIVEVIERELKFAASEEFELPDLASVVAGSRLVELVGLELDAVYYDTDDLRLARRNVTLRRRTGEGPPRWTLKFPEVATSGLGSTGLLARREIELDDPVTEPPVELAVLVTAYVRSAGIAPVARLVTRRNRTQLIAADDSVLCSIDDDSVAVMPTNGDGFAFREVELEFSAGAETHHVVALADVMRNAGAGTPDPTPKLVRALGQCAVTPPEVVAFEVRSDADIAERAKARLSRSVVNLLDLDHVVRLEDDAEALRRLREVATGLVTDIETVRDLTEPAVVKPAVVKPDMWESVIGPMQRLVAELDAARSTDDQLEVDGRTDMTALRALISTERYVGLLDCLVEMVADPGLH